MRPDEIRELIREEVRKAIATNESKAIHPSMITPGMIKSRHLFDKAIMFGDEADLPTDSSTGVFCYFAVDTDTLYCYGDGGWVSEVLT